MLENGVNDMKEKCIQSLFNCYPIYLVSRGWGRGFLQKLPTWVKVFRIIPDFRILRLFVLMLGIGKTAISGFENLDFRNLEF